MTAEDDYKKLISEIIQKQMDLLGPDIAIKKANGVSGLRVADDGGVTSLTGSPQQVLKELIDQYMALSGEIVKNILGPVFAKYPEIKFNFE